MLKGDFHIHTKEDPKDDFRISYSAKELIDFASIHQYDVIAITNHDQVVYTKSLAYYAKDKGILLIPGIEKTVNGKHVLIYNITQKQADSVKRISDVEALRKKGAVVVAPHPFFHIFQSLQKDLVENIDCFDAIEFSAQLNNFFTFFLNENKEAVRMAALYKKPLLANSDSHSLHEMNNTYSLLDCKKDTKSVLDAIKKNKIQIVTRRSGIFGFIKSVIAWTYADIRRRLQRIVNKKRA